MFRMAIKTDNSAFHDDDREYEDDTIQEAARVEVARILRNVAGHVQNGADCGPVIDANGNTVGEWSL